MPPGGTKLWNSLIFASGLQAWERINPCCQGTKSVATCYNDCRNLIQLPNLNGAQHKRSSPRQSRLQFKYLSSVLCGEGNGTLLQYSCLENPMEGGAWKAAVHGVAEGQTRLSDFSFTFHFHALEEKMATHSSILAWRIPGTGDPGGLPSMGSHRVGHH